MKQSVCVALLCLSACHQGNGEIRAQGYIEADHINIAPQVTGRIDAVLVKEGDRTQAGAPLVKLDPIEANSLLDQAKARLAESESSFRDSEAALRAAEPEFHRQRQLVANHVSAQARLDTARQALESAQARLASARSAIEAARGAVAQAEWQVAQRAIAAPADGVVDEIFFRPGEVATAGRVILSILPPQNRKALFFVRQAELAHVALGAQVFIACAGCGPNIPARITFIANEAEFTPPVIYSLETRDKLVFKIEAKPIDANAALRVGQPVQVIVSGP